MKGSFKGFVLGLLVGLILFTSALGGAIADRIYGIPLLDFVLENNNSLNRVQQRVLSEESAVIDVVEAASPSVVTVSIKKTQTRAGGITFDPFSGFRRIPGTAEIIEQDIGSGFVVSNDGIIITNKHVVSDTNASYKVITSNDKEYEVKTIKRDPGNDLAILKVDAIDLKPLELGDSENLKAGQFVIAIGTALGEFRHTVTTGVISGLGRGITAGDAYAGYIEEIDNVIQTDAAINPGNSGGPLLNSAGQVIGVNVAVAANAENIGFALPVSLLKRGLEEFNKTGNFATKPFLGVRYQMISERAALLNEVPQGVYVIDIEPGSPAETAGIEPNDIIIELDGKKLEDVDSLADIIAGKEVGDQLKVKVWRGEEEMEIDVTLSAYGGED